MTKKVICGPSSSVIAEPSTLPNTNGFNFYKLTYPANGYEIEQFTNTNTVCAINSITIEPIVGGTQDDFTVSSVKAIITSSLTDSKINVKLPETESVV